ncbi:MAG TPA: YtcA family lipoprotein [Candidatus Binatus sp.]|jgi:YtcA-like protein|nr:YtcA family lipoprotein [Candidatus Binatus sp.]
MLDASTTSPPTTACSPIRSRFSSRRRRPGVDRGYRRGRGRLAVAVLLPLAGCGIAPSVNILGSFFPAWLICIVIGLVITILTLQGFVAMKIASNLGPAALVYPCLAALWTFATWLVLFGG